MDYISQSLLMAAAGQDGTRDTFLSVIHSNSPYISVYKRTPGTDTFVKLPDLDQLPTTAPNGVSSSADGGYWMVVVPSNPFIYLYARQGDSFTSLSVNSDSKPLPSSSPLCVYLKGEGISALAYIGLIGGPPAPLSGNLNYGLILPSGYDPIFNTTMGADSTRQINHIGGPLNAEYVSFAFETGLAFETHRTSNGSLSTKITDPSPTPPGSGKAIAWTSDGSYVAVGHTVSPFVTMYARSGDTLIKVPDPSTLPPSASLSAAFSPDTNFLALAHSFSPFVTIYFRNGGLFTRLSNPTGGLPTGAANGVSFSHDSAYLAVSHENSPFITIYARNGGSFSKVANPAILPTGLGRGCSF